MSLKYFLFRVVRKICRQKKINLENTDIYTDYKDQAANDYIKNLLHDYFSQNKKTGLMFAKFGTIELSTYLCFRKIDEGLSLKDRLEAIRGFYNIFPKEQTEALCNNAGFFPISVEEARKFAYLFHDDVYLIDVLASYIYNEKYLEKELKNCIRVNLDGYYAPFLWSDPWTKELEGKKVLVVHPFTESIKKQYDKRKLLFENKNVLPDFKELILIKAIQSVAGNKPDNFDTWFEALDYMEKEISSKDFDVAIIGCGAYGMELAAYIKRMGKVAIHLAGWTQMLFGIYGSRWLNDQPQYAKFINEYWIRPSDNEKPKNANRVENGCYW